MSGHAVKGGTNAAASSLTVRPATLDDADAIWAILAPILRAGETYALPRDWTREEALAFWFLPHHEVFAAVDGARVLGTYYLQPNQLGGGSHIANCGYMTAPDAGGRGVATAMCEHSLRRAAERAFRAMQFNLVLCSNERAIRLWLRLGFTIVGTVPQAFAHPRLGMVDALVMYRTL